MISGRANCSGRGIVGGPFLLLLSILSVSGAGAQTVTSAPAAAKPAQAAKPGKTTDEGMKVHGHWVIDVRNPDGTLAEHRDFENSLAAPYYLVELLYGSAVTQDFSIVLSSPTPPCTGGAGATCSIVRNTGLAPAVALCQNGNFCATGLTVTLGSGPPPAVVLAGNMTAPQAGTISTVATWMALCGSYDPTLSTLSPSQCTNSAPFAYGPFTQTTITPINVVQGQIVQVTVTISFS